MKGRRRESKIPVPVYFCFSVYISLYRPEIQPRHRISRRRGNQGNQENTENPYKTRENKLLKM